MYAGQHYSNDYSYTEAVASGVHTKLQMWESTYTYAYTATHVRLSPQVWTVLQAAEGGWVVNSGLVVHSQRLKMLQEVEGIATVGIMGHNEEEAIGDQSFWMQDNERVRRRVANLFD